MEPKNWPNRAGVGMMPPNVRAQLGAVDDLWVKIGAAIEAGESAKPHFDALDFMYGRNPNDVPRRGEPARVRGGRRRRT